MTHRTRWLARSILSITLAAILPGLSWAQTNWPAEGGPSAAGRTSIAPEQSPQPPAPQPPFQLTAAQQQAVDQLLTYWERYSSRVKRYRCSFTWWEYDSNFGPQDPNTAKTCSDGELRYEAPDKGLFHVVQVKHHTKQPDGTIKYLPRPGENGKYWTCNGKAIFQFDYLNKRLRVAELPPQMQGAGIADGPLPFLFGAKAEKIKGRYWVQIIAPPEGKEGQEYWLQAFPKTRKDAANFKMVEVILDAKLFLPSAIQVYDPGYNGRGNFSRSVFVFHDRKVNERLSLNLLKGDPFTPNAPLGWRKVVEKNTVPAPIGPATPPPQRPEGQTAEQPLFDGIER